MKKIYLDHGATTPVDRKVLKAMLPYFSEKFGNAMSLHSFGREASEAVEKARRQTAGFFDASPDEIIFTSGATESNNLVIKGVLKAYWQNIRSNLPQISSHSRVPHIITTAFEHHCILDACKSAQKEGLAEITFVKPDREGIISIESIKKAIRPNTILVSIMYVNNEIGTTQPVSEIGKLISSLRTTRLAEALAKRAKGTKIRKMYPLFHTDATQAVNYFDCNVKKIAVDFLSMSAHKIYGPKGVGALYAKKGTAIVRVQDGGDQEFSKRAGTHNVAGIVGLGAAISQLACLAGRRATRNSQLTNKRIQEFRNYLIKRVLKEIPDSKLNGSKKFRSPNNANFIFARVEEESLILMLDRVGIAASTGSACSSGSLEPSHVLLSIGLKPEEAHGSLRLTLGKNTTKKDIDVTIEKLKKIVANLRKVSGNVLKEYYKKNNI